MLMNPAVRSSSTESSNTVAFDNVDYAAAADDGDGGNDTVVTVRVVGLMMVNVIMVAVI
jgi:hypothetical protein